MIKFDEEPDVGIPHVRICRGRSRKGPVYQTDALFGWLEDLWKARRYTAPDFDPRDDLQDDSSVLERQAERLNSLEKTVNVSYYWK